MGFEISKIKNAVLKALATSIDEDNRCQGKEKGKLEDGAELSVFLAKSASILMVNNKQEVMDEVLTVADSADKNTYEMFKSGLIETINKASGGNIPLGFNSLLQILDRMTSRFEKETDKPVITELEKEVAGEGSVINTEEIKPE